VQADGELLDQRSRSLSGEPTWVRSGLEIFSRSSTMTSHDWLQIMQSAGDYILAGVVQDKRRLTALYALVAACQGCLTAISPAGIDDREKINKLKIQVAEALSLCELVSSVTSSGTFSTCVHQCIHVMRTGAAEDRDGCHVPHPPAHARLHVQVERDQKLLGVLR
jgi:hypothetical protein